jgi:signal peptidase I
VLESAPIPAFDITADPVPTPGVSGETKRHLLAALFSAIVPGAGQLWIGQRRKAIVLLLIFAALLMGFWPLRFLSSYVGFAILCCGWIALYIYAACSALRARSPETEVRPSKWWLIAILPVTFLTLSLLWAVVTRASGFRSFTVPSPSMEKTVLKGEQIVADMRYYHARPPDRRDIIVFNREGTFYIKRVIAVGGDTIQGMGETVFVNGQTLIEPYVEHTSRDRENWMVNFGPVTVGNGKYFVMGDNRDISLDSRWPAFGLIDKESVVGKPLYVFGSDRPGKHVR